MSEPQPKPEPEPTKKTLLKHNSWAPGYERDQLWLRQRRRHRRSKSLTDDDFAELRACVELGFGFESPDIEGSKRLSNTFPALEFYYTVTNNKAYNDTVLKSKSTPCLSSISVSSDCESSTSSPASDSPLATIFSPGDDPDTIKRWLRHWALVVACSARQTL